MVPKKHSKAGFKKPTELFVGLSEKRLRDRVSDITFERGEEYFGAGCVKDLRIQRNEVRAEVDGTLTYQVKLWDDGKHILGTCICPAYEDMGFCKHCVATSLALLDMKKKGRLADHEILNGKKSWATMDDIRRHLREVDRKKLEDWVMGWASEDADFQSVLEAEATKAKRKKAGRKGRDYP